MQSVLVKLQSRGVKMELWGASINHYELSSRSYVFADIANALREENYLEKEFKAGRSGLQRL